jgi:DNA invertase Pin-like site-specific DNA recombinase
VQPTAKAKSTQVFELTENGMSREAVAKELGIDVRSVYRIVRDAKGGTQTDMRVMPQ